jgi:hypothetical protein
MQNTDEPIYKGPHSLSPYPMHLGSPKIVPHDRGKIRAIAVDNIYKGAEMQMNLLRRQADLLIKQAEEIESRISISERIYMADMGFEPVSGIIYHLYKSGDREVISLIGPHEWGVRGCLFGDWLATMRLLGDKTWEIIESSEIYK